MIDLSTTYLGLSLRNPLVVSASPLSEDMINIREMEDAGASAIVLPSLFEEQLSIESQDLAHQLAYGSESSPEALTYFPDMADYNFGAEGYIEHIRQVKSAVNIPIIASLNGTQPGAWVRFAREMEQAGADALELNIYYLPTDPNLTSEKMEERYCDLVTLVKSNIRIPVAVKLSPYFTALANLGDRLSHAGADALVLFNRFYQPDIDLDQLEITPSLTLSSPYELLLRLHWVAILYAHVHCDLAVTGGIHEAKDVLKAMMAGAKVAMMTSALLKRGIGHLNTVRTDLIRWMEEHDYESIRQMQGSMSYRKVANPAALERANYMKVLRSYSLTKVEEG
jgi:dihydroorotate dehydrogenase (fumarate)